MVNNFKFVRTGVTRHLRLGKHLPDGYEESEDYDVYNDEGQKLFSITVMGTNYRNGVAVTKEEINEELIRRTKEELSMIEPRQKLEDIANINEDAVIESLNSLLHKILQTVILQRNMSPVAWKIAGEFRPKNFTIIPGELPLSLGSFHYNKIPDWSKKTHELKRVFIETPEAKVILEFLAKYNVERATFTNLYNFMETFFWKLLNIWFDEDENSLSKIDLQKLSTDFINQRLGKEVGYYAQIYVFGIWVTEEIKINENFPIRPIQESDIKYTTDTPFFNSGFDPFNYPTCVIQISGKYRNNIGIQKKVKKIPVILTLFIVANPEVLKVKYESDYIGKGVHGYHSGTARIRGGTTKWIITEAEKERLISFIDKINKDGVPEHLFWFPSSEVDPYFFPYHQYLISISTGSILYRITMAIMGLESLLISKQKAKASEGEILNERTAVLLKLLRLNLPSPDFVKDCYVIRNKYVHGDIRISLKKAEELSKKLQIVLNEIPERLSEYFRLIILIFIGNKVDFNNTMTRRKVQEQISKAISSNEKDMLENALLNGINLAKMTLG